MKLAETFTYRTLYGNYPDCYFKTGRYAYGNGISIDIYNDELGPIARVTTNLTPPVPDGYIAIKNYSENENMLSEMQRIGLVTNVINHVESGYVSVPVCEYSEEILKKFGG